MPPSSFSTSVGCLKLLGSQIIEPGTVNTAMYDKGEKEDLSEFKANRVLGGRRHLSHGPRVGIKGYLAAIGRNTKRREEHADVM